MMTLQESIYKTLYYFNLAYDAPLSLEQIHYFLWKNKADIIDVSRALSVMEDVQQLNGYYVLKQFSGILDTVDERHKQFEIDWKKITNEIIRLSHIPFIRCVGISSRHALGLSKPNSDIDLFFIVKPNRLYFSRALLGLYLKMRGLKTNLNDRSGKICLGSFITSNCDNLKQLFFNDDYAFIYKTFWMVNLLPLLGREEYKRFVDANNWIFDYFPNFNVDHKIEGMKNIASSKTKIFFEASMSNWIGDFFEFLLAKLQLRFVPRWQRFAKKKYGVSKFSMKINHAIFMPFIIRFEKEYQLLYQDK